MTARMACPDYTSDTETLICRPDGSYCMNPRKGLDKFFWVNAVGPNNTYPTTFAGNEQNMLVFTIPAEENLRGDFQICDFMSKSTDRFAVQLFQAATNRYFSNQPIPNNCLFGTPNFPGVLAETIYAQPTTVVQAQITNLTGLANTINLVAKGRRFLDYGHEREGAMRAAAFYAKLSHPFWLTNNNGPEQVIAAGATVQILVNVPAAADFLCSYLMDDSTSTGGAPDYTVQIFEGLSSRALMTAPLLGQDFVFAPTSGSSGMRAAGLPTRICNWTHLFKRSSIISMTVTNTSGGDLTLRFAMHGRLIYYNEPKGTFLTVPESIYNRPEMQPAPLQQYGQPMACPS
jgi:hypothetical protein